MTAARLRPAIFTLQAVIVIALVGFVFDLQDHLRWSLYSEQFLALVLGACLGLAYLTPPQGAASDRVPMLDIAAAAIGFAACIYVAIAYPSLSQLLAERPPAGVALSIVIIVLVLEGTRRTSGPSLVWVVLGFIAYALLGHFLPEPFTSRPVDVTRLAVYLGIDSNAMFGASLLVASGVVAAFIVFGQVLMRCGGGDFFTDVASGLMGRYRGGAAKIAVTGSALFGMISGSAVANVAAVGVVTIPMMVRAGFAPQFSAAVEAVGSTGGQLMPPVMGAAAFLMAEYLQVPYAEVMVAAIIPSFLYYLALFVQVDLESAKNGIRGAPRESLPAAGAVLRSGWHFPIPFAVLVGGLLWWNLEAEYAALIATVVLIGLSMAFGYRGRRLTPGEALRAVVSAGEAVIEIIAVTAVSGLLIGALNLTGVAFALTQQLLTVSGGSLLLLLVVTAFVAFVLGLGLPTVGVYVILATLAAPALVQAGLEPMQAHMFVLFNGILSMLTPPVALAAFAAAAIAKADQWKTGWTASRMGWAAYLIPFFFAYSPLLIMRGSAHEVVAAVAVAALGIAIGSVAVVGYLRKTVSGPMRVAYGAIACLLLLPASAVPGGVWINAAGVALAAGAIWRELARSAAAPAIPGGRPTGPS